MRAGSPTPCSTSIYCGCPPSAPWRRAGFWDSGWASAPSLLCFARGFGLSAFKSGQLTFAAALGALTMKFAAKPICARLVSGPCFWAMPSSRAWQRSRCFARTRLTRAVLLIAILPLAAVHQHQHAGLCRHRSAAHEPGHQFPPRRARRLSLSAGVATGAIILHLTMAGRRSLGGDGLRARVPGRRCLRHAVGAGLPALRAMPAPRSVGMCRRLRSGSWRGSSTSGRLASARMDDSGDLTILLPAKQASLVSHSQTTITRQPARSRLARASTHDVSGELWLPIVEISARTPFQKGSLGAGARSTHAQRLRSALRTGYRAARRGSPRGESVGRAKGMKRFPYRQRATVDTVDAGQGTRCLRGI